ncbi:MAG: PD-(D/E)XK nuclease family protein, partial [Brevinematia bacterium]
MKNSQINLFSKQPLTIISKTNFINFLNCKYTWYLANVKKIKPKLTLNMEAGNTLHSILKEINQKFSTLEEVKKFIELKKLSLKEHEKEINNILLFLESRNKKNLNIFPVISETSLEIRVSNFKLKGIVDAIYNFEDEFEIFEYKKSFYKSKIEDFFLETSFYSFLFENSQKRKIIRMGLFSFETGEVI